MLVTLDQLTRPAVPVTVRLDTLTVVDLDRLAAARSEAEGREVTRADLLRAAVDLLLREAGRTDDAVEGGDRVADTEPRSGVGHTAPTTTKEEPCPAP